MAAVHTALEFNGMVTFMFPYSHTHFIHNGGEEGGEGGYKECGFLDVLTTKHPNILVQYGTLVIGKFAGGLKDEPNTNRRI